MASELEKTLKRMRVNLKATQLIATPACGFSPTARPWRITLTRDQKEGEKPLKLTITMLSGTPPGIETVVKCLITDTKNCELTLWDFAQEFNQGETNEGTEHMYKTCKRLATRVQRFFGDSWDKVVNKAA